MDKEVIKCTEIGVQMMHDLASAFGGYSQVSRNDIARAIEGQINNSNVLNTTCVEKMVSGAFGVLEAMYDDYDSRDEQIKTIKIFNDRFEMHGDKSHNDFKINLTAKDTII